MGALGKLGVYLRLARRGEYPPQPMVTQIQTVLEQYVANGGRVQIGDVRRLRYMDRSSTPRNSGASCSSISSAPLGNPGCRRLFGESSDADEPEPV